MGKVGFVIDAFKWISRVSKPAVRQAPKQAAKGAKADSGNAAKGTATGQTQTAPKPKDVQTGQQVAPKKASVPSLQEQLAKIGIKDAGIVLNHLSDLGGGRVIHLGQKFVKITEDVFERLKGPECTEKAKNMVVRLLDKYRVKGNPIMTEIKDVYEKATISGVLRIEGNMAYLRVSNVVSGNAESIALQGKVIENKIIFDLFTLIK